MEMKLRNTDVTLMTKGPIAKQMIAFAIPIFLGQLISTVV